MRSIQSRLIFAFIVLQCLLTTAFAEGDIVIKGRRLHPSRFIAQAKTEKEGQVSTDFASQKRIKIFRRTTKSKMLLLESEELKGSGTAFRNQPGTREERYLAKLKELQSSGLFEFVEPDFVVQASLSPSDTRFTDGTLWGLKNFGQNNGVAGMDLNAEAAWNVTTGSTNLIVAVIDTGIRYTHRDLVSQMWKNPGEVPGNRLDDDGDGFVDNVHGINAIIGNGDPMDDNGHGTHVAGTIGAAANDANPHVGVAWKVQLMALKFMDASGSGYTSDSIDCLNFAVANGARVVNASWGGSTYSQSLYNAISNAASKGVMVIAAAGNDGENADSSAHYPSGYNLENIISVAAIDRSGNLASFSNFGALSVDLGAPGVSIYSTTHGSDTEYKFFNGTSMATPHVAGVAALVLSAQPGLTIPEIRRRLTQGVVPLPSLQGKTATGGRIDAYKALQVAPDGQLELTIVPTPNSAIYGDEPCQLFVHVTDDLPVVNAQAQVTYAGSTFALKNDGTFPDTTAGDFIYSGTFSPSAGATSVELSLYVSAVGKQPVTMPLNFSVRRRPSNDLFNQRTLLTATGATAGNNEGAGRELGEPVHPSNNGGASVWWSWKAPHAGIVTVHTEGSKIDTLLGVYRGNSLDGLVSVVQDDDSGVGTASKATFSSVPGVDYHFCVDGYDGSSGNLSLNVSISPDPNSDINTPPYISTVPNYSILEDASGSLSFQVSDGQTPSNELSVSAVSLNTGLIPNQFLVLGGVGSNRSIRFSGLTNASGKVTIQLTVSDGKASTSTSFQVEITPVNDAPTLGNLPHQSLPVQNNGLSINLPASDVESPATNLTFSAVASNTQLLPAEAIHFSVQSGQPILQLYPSAGIAGSSQVQVNVRDPQGASFSRSFTLSVVFSAPAGMYQALIYNPDGLELVGTGFLTLTLHADQQFDALLTLDGTKHRFQGDLGLDGKSKNTIVRPGKSNLQLLLDLSGADGGVGGTLTVDNMVSQIIGDALLIPGNHFIPAGKFTVAVPQGDAQMAGYLTLTMNAAGKGRLQGVFADGTRIMQRGSLSSGCRWPLFAVLPKEQGMVVGWIQLPQTSEESLVGGNLVYLKKMSPGSNLESTLEGATFVTPKNNPLSSGDLRTLTFTLAGRTTSYDVRFTPEGRIETLGAQKPFTLSISKASGVVRGTWMPSGRADKIVLQGIFLQQPGEVLGFFNDQGSLGTFRLMQ